MPSPSLAAPLSTPSEVVLHDRLVDIAGRFRRPTFASSLSAEDMVLLDAIDSSGASIEVFVIDTGRLPAETLALLETARTRYRTPIEVVRPDPSGVDRFVAEHGLNGFYDGVPQRLACCAARKVEPLGRALAGHDAWLTGQRRAHGPERAGLALEEDDAGHGMAKFNPLADWSDAELWAHVAARDIPVSTLYARGYASIGCEPCTRAIRPHEEPRAGRWWWEQGGAAKECGLHLPPIRIEPVAAPSAVLAAVSGERRC